VRKTRLHNNSGRILDAAGFLYLPESILTSLSVKLARRRPELPLLGFRAIKHLARIIRPGWRVLEFGSGMSTVWLARRCELLVSIETNRLWYNEIKSALARRSLKNVDYKFRDPQKAHVLKDYEASSFDLVLVDGLRRDRAMMTALLKVKAGGYVYLDNSDEPFTEHQTARAMLEAAGGGAASVKIFNDLTPARFCVTEGMLAQIFNKTAALAGEAQ
jgi:hypothetical protein